MSPESKDSQSLDEYQMSEQMLEILSSGLISLINHDDQLALQRYVFLESKLKSLTEGVKNYSKVRSFVADMAGKLLSGPIQEKVGDFLGTRGSEARRIEQEMTEIKASFVGKYSSPMLQLGQVFFSLDRIPQNFLHIYTDKWIILENEMSIILGAIKQQHSSLPPRSSAGESIDPGSDIQGFGSRSCGYRDTTGGSEFHHPVTGPAFIGLLGNVHHTPV